MPDEVSECWEHLCSKFTSNSTLVQELWQELEHAYTSKDRYYHNLNHLAYMLQLAAQFEQEIQDPELLRFAIFYHDVIYSPLRKNNEEKSAALAYERLLSIGLKPEQLELVKEMIWATKKHSKNQNRDINILLDFDLAILGADRQKYEVYRQAVRKEYSIYPDLIYIPGRRKVLQHFLAQPHIYKTLIFQEMLELQAKENLQFELKLLG